MKDFYDQIPVLIREMVYRLNDDNKDVLKANHKAFAALSKHVPAEELVNHIEFMRNLINSMVSDARRRKGGVGDGEFLLPGFNIPKGERATEIEFTGRNVMNLYIFDPDLQYGVSTISLSDCIRRDLYSMKLCDF